MALRNGNNSGRSPLGVAFRINGDWRGRGQAHFAFYPPVVVRTLQVVIPAATDLFKQLAAVLSGGDPGELNGFVLAGQGRVIQVEHQVRIVCRTVSRSEERRVGNGYAPS